MTNSEWNGLSKPERIELLKRRAQTAMMLHMDKYGKDAFEECECKRDGDDELYVFTGKHDCTIRLNTVEDRWTFET